MITEFYTDKVFASGMRSGSDEGAGAKCNEAPERSEARNSPPGRPNEILSGELFYRYIDNSYKDSLEDSEIWFTFELSLIIKI